MKTIIRIKYEPTFSGDRLINNAHMITYGGIRAISLNCINRKLWFSIFLQKARTRSEVNKSLLAENRMINNAVRTNRNPI